MVLVFLVLFAYLAFALLAETEGEASAAPAAADIGVCPGCSRPVEGDWLLCPRCRTLLKGGCSGCSRQIEKWRSFCPWCGRETREETV